MATNEGFAPAKINLTLHVTGQRADGYHLLDSLVVFANIGDRLWFEPADTMSLAVSGPFGAGVPEDNRNLVWRAAELAGATLGIRLAKHLPHGAGIGGGSSDAAAVLRFLNASEQAAKLGADVPVCLSSSPQRMQGIGEQLTTAPSVPALHLVLVNPQVHVATPEVFKALKDKSNSGMSDLPDWKSTGEFVTWLQAQRNDLQAPAMSMAPVIGTCLQALNTSRGCVMARMSGSGATCFGIYHTGTQARLAAKSLAAANPGWWVKRTRTTGRDLS